MKHLSVWFVSRASVVDMNHHYRLALLDCLRHRLASVTERLREMVGAPYLVNRRVTIIATTLVTRHCRHKILKFVSDSSACSGGAYRQRALDVFR